MERIELTPKIHKLVKIVEELTKNNFGQKMVVVMNVQTFELFFDEKVDRNGFYPRGEIMGVPYYVDDITAPGHIHAMSEEDYQQSLFWNEVQK
jgi:hypothetical protein